MKILNSIQELWDHCQFCPICRKKCRQIKLDVGPDEAVDLTRFHKFNDILEITFLSNLFKQYTIKLLVNCFTNSFETEIINESSLQTHPALTVKLKKPYFYFYIQSNCPRCHRSQSFSSDMEFSFLEKKIIDIGLEREEVNLLHNDDQFHVSLLYDQKSMVITRGLDLLLKGIAVPLKKMRIKLPLANLDFSNQEKAINRIKTFILFS